MWSNDSEMDRRIQNYTSATLVLLDKTGRFIPTRYYRVIASSYKMMIPGMVEWIGHRISYKAQLLSNNPGRKDNILAEVLFEASHRHVVVHRVSLTQGRGCDRLFPGWSDARI